MKESKVLKKHQMSNKRKIFNKKKLFKFITIDHKVILEMIHLKLKCKVFLRKNR